jgi:hypothetical protein
LAVAFGHNPGPAAHAPSVWRSMTLTARRCWPMFGTGTGRDTSKTLVADRPSAKCGRCRLWVVIRVVLAVRRPSGRPPPPFRFGIITRRTGLGRYVFETNSSRRPASHASRPDVSIAAKVTPSTPGAPALPRASV